MTARARSLKDLSARIQSLARFYQLRRKDHVCRHHITVSQCYALETLAGAGLIGVTELATALGVNKSTASRVVDSLCAQGLAAWAPLPHDARTKRVAPTAAGRTLAGRIHRDIEAEHARLLRPFSRRDLDVCRMVFTALADARRCRP